MIQLDDNEAPLFSPENAEAHFQKCLKFMSDYYETTLNMGEYSKVTYDDNVDERLLMLQYIINYVHSRADIDNKWIYVAWAMQAAFWLGYTFDKREPELPESITNVLKGL